jgi:isopentenyldiphosphate isomerase
MEYIDIYNEDGIKTGEQILKSIAHQNGIIHKTVHVWILNENNEILMQKRSSNRDYFPNVWDPTHGGHIQSGESSLAAVIREINEELGISINNNDVEFMFCWHQKLEYNSIINDSFMDVYLVKKSFDLNYIKIQEEELSEVKLVTIKELEEIINKKENLFPHYDEYKEMLEILKKRYLN